MRIYKNAVSNNVHKTLHRKNKEETGHKIGVFQLLRD